MAFSLDTDVSESSTSDHNMMKATTAYRIYQLEEESGASREDDSELNDLNFCFFLR